VRAPSLGEARETAQRVLACFKYIPSFNSHSHHSNKNTIYSAAAQASACQVTIKEIKPPCYELRQNKALGMSQLANFPVLRSPILIQLIQVTHWLKLSTTDMAISTMNTESGVPQLIL